MNEEKKNNAEQIDEVEILQNKILELEKANSNLKDQLLRKAAEFENYKKRIENDFVNITKFANEYLVEKLIPVLDDFERFLQHAQEENSNTANNPFYKGVELIYNKMIKILEQQGLKKMETAGQPFDVNLHDALMVIPTNDPKTAPNIVLQEVEKGYMLHDKVIRHAKVIVSGDNETNNTIEGGGD